MNGIPFPDISPEVFSFTLGGFTLALRWYALAYIAGILIGWRIARAAVLRPGLWQGGEAPMDRAMLEAFMTWIILGIILGGRIGYVLFYQPQQYLSDPAAILRVWEGGMSFHGGLAGVVVATLVFCRTQGIALGPTSDMIALGVAPGLFLGRIANFINAELWGRPTDLPWGVIFPGEAAQDCAGALTGLCARHPSQLYEALLEGLVLGALVLFLAFRRGALRRPWLVTGVFSAGYGTARFLVEFVRQPDAQFVAPGNPLGLAFEAGGWGLTMGQALSLPMILAGLGLVLWAARRN
ncbi:MAG: prolipoprotein diacylglyceryl transferase [Rubellimicrobium sp.]|nr:prolipoprotein diacylglyceryl transferase [Rubellimicrobium sp.]